MCWFNPACRSRSAILYDHTGFRQLSIRIHNPPGENQQQQVHMSLLPDFHLNVKTTSLLGSRAKLQGEV
jgi:hypothetical protein